MRSRLPMLFVLLACCAMVFVSCTKPPARRDRSGLNDTNSTDTNSTAVDTQ